MPLSHASASMRAARLDHATHIRPRQTRVAV
jgi:hypothetical protein